MTSTTAPFAPTRRQILVQSAAALALAGFAGRDARLVAAQASTPAAGGGPFAALGLPEIAVTVTDSAYEGVPAELAAGRYVLKLTNAIAAPNEDVAALLDFAGAGFMQVPAEFAADEFMAMMTSPPAPETGSPAAELHAEGPPPWYYETILSGGPYAARGETDYAVIDLTAGNWVLWGEDPAAPQLPVAVRVTGDLPADLPAPAAPTRIEMSDFAFAIDPLAAGQRTIELANVGVQPHFLGLTQVPAGTTVEDFLTLSAALFGDPSVTAPANLSADDLRIVLDSADQSAGVTSWHRVDLDAGSYVAVCFVIDPETGLPHAMLGMAQIVEVA